MRVVFEDKWLLVIDKKAGVAVNDIESGLLVHRIDKQTSGLLILAKNKQVLDKMQQQFKKRLVKKTYLALVHGEMETKQDKVNAPIRRSKKHRLRFEVNISGRMAETNYRLKQVYLSQEGEKLSLLEVTPVTGRTHQIRVHMKFINHPLVSDDFYLNKDKLIKDLKWCPRLFLHAYKLQFKHPDSNKIMDLQTELATDLKQALTKLKKLDIGS